MEWIYANVSCRAAIKGGNKNTEQELIALAKQVEERLRDCKKPIKVAVMGCIVNGPGEAKEADIGIAGGDSCGLIFKKGVCTKTNVSHETRQ